VAREPFISHHHSAAIGTAATDHTSTTIQTRLSAKRRLKVIVTIAQRTPNSTARRTDTRPSSWFPRAVITLVSSAVDGKPAERRSGRPPDGEKLKIVVLI
jgi:hypothetical protein